MLKVYWKKTSRFIQAMWYEEERQCVFCGQAGQVICSVCKDSYLRPELNRCRSCGKLLREAKSFCLDCEAGKGPRWLDRVTAWGYYSGDLKKLIQQVKFEARPRRLQKIAQPFADWAIRNLPVADGLVAVPMHAVRLAERGFNQAEVLASALHWELGLPVLEGLEKVRSTPSQVSLSRQERLLNLQDAFVVRNSDRFKGRSIWVVDDVTTTGATLQALAGVLKSCGVQNIYGLCLAAGMEKEPG